MFIRSSERPNRAGSAEPLAIFGRAGSAESSVNLAEPPSLVLTKIPLLLNAEKVLFLRENLPILKFQYQF